MITVENCKRFTTLQAKAALAGITFHRIEGDFGHLVYVATCGAMTCHFDDLDEVACWLDGVTADISARDDGAFAASPCVQPVWARVQRFASARLTAA